ncbi:MAG TPA: hypothetical protein VGR00_04240, partial [Thermoanaerobaculia bacterium]|nr:hypothetical protein [Thermoanaerobaculia bacterium]
FWAVAVLFVAAALLVGGPFAFLARLLPGVKVVFLSRLRLVALFAAAVLVSLGVEALARTPLGRIRLVVPALVLFLALDLSSADSRFDPFPSRPDAPPGATPALLRLRRVAPGDGRRFLAFGTAVVPNEAFELGLEDLRAHQLHSAGYRRLLSRLDPSVYGRHGTFLTFEPETFHPDPILLDLLGVTALLAPPKSAAPGGDFTLDAAGADGDVYVRRWKPPARVVSRQGPSMDETGKVASFEAHATTWRVEVESDGEATLLLGRSRLSAVDRIRVDGRPVDPVADARAEGLVAVPLPAGRHRVEVDAALPRELAVASGVGFLALAVLLASATLRRN